MTSPASSKFWNRSKDISVYFRSLRDLERNIKIPGKKLYSGLPLVAHCRASAYVMTYNAIEFGVAEALSAIRKEIESRNHLPDEIHSYWLSDAIKVRFSEKMRTGIDHTQIMNDFAEFIYSPTK